MASDISLPASLAASYWAAKSARAKNPPKNKITESSKTFATQFSSLTLNLCDLAKVVSAADLTKRSDALDAEKKTAEKLVVQAKDVAREVEQFVKAAGKELDKDVAKAAELIKSDASSCAEESKKKIDAALKELKDKLAVATKAGAKPAAAPAAAPALSKADAKFIGDRCRKAIAAAINNKAGIKPATFALVKRAKTVQIVMGSASDVAKGIAKLAKPVNGKKPPVLKDPKSQVIFEKGVITLVSDRIPPKFARQIQLALKLQTGKGPKVRMRKTTGEAEESGGGEEVNADMFKVDEEAVDPKEAAAAKADFDRRWAKAKADVAKALPSRSQEEKVEIAGLLKDADSAAHKSDYIDALETLEAILDILDTTPIADDEDAPVAAVAKPPPAKDGKSDLAAHRDAWNDTCKSAVGEITTLRGKIAAMFSDGSQADALKGALGTLDMCVATLKNDVLSKQLAAAADPKNASRRDALAASAKQTVAQLRKFVDQHPVMKELDDNEVHKISAAGTVSAKLKEIENALA
jgi:hypothetical protein